MTPQHLKLEEYKINRLVYKLWVDPKGKSSPITDGVIDASLYLKAPVKILWILKEPWCDHDLDGTPTGGGWSLRDVLKTETERLISDVIFRKLYYIAYAIFTGVRVWDNIPYPKDDRNAIVAFQSIAYINAKKLPGLRDGVPDSVILNGYNMGRAVILKQIELYNPDVIFGCRPHMRQIIKDIAGTELAMKQTGHAWHCQTKDTIFIEGYHPRQRTIRHEQYVMDMLAAYDSAKRKG